MAKTDVANSALEFGMPGLWDALQALREEPERYDALEFGLVAMDGDGIVLAYNAAEAEFAGLAADRVIGRHFFTDVAPCTNNYLVASRFEEEAWLDETIDYVFTIKMRPTRVRLRLLKDEAAGRLYLVVKWK